MSNLQRCPHLDERLLPNEILAFDAFINAIEQDGANLLVIADDRGAVQLFWRRLLRIAAQKPIQHEDALKARQQPFVSAFADFSRIALSPAILMSGLNEAIGRAITGDEVIPDGVPGYMLTDRKSGIPDPMGSEQMRNGLLASFRRLADYASREGRRPFVVIRDFASLRALGSYKTIGSPFAHLGSALREVPDVRLVLLEYCTSADAVLSMAAGALEGMRLRTFVIPSLSSDMAQLAVAEILGVKPVEDEPEFFRSLCDGRISYLEALCGAIGWKPSKAILKESLLVSLVADLLSDQSSSLSLLCQLKLRDVLSSVRGDTALRHIMRILSFGDGLTASQIASKLGKSIPASYDYLQWLLRSLVLYMSDGRYFFSDRVLMLWLRLDTQAASRMHSLSEDSTRSAVREVLLGSPPRRKETPMRPEAVDRMPEDMSTEESREAEDKVGNDYKVVRRRIDDLMEFD